MNNPLNSITQPLVEIRSSQNVARVVFSRTLGVILTLLIVAGLVACIVSFYVGNDLLTVEQYLWKFLVVTLLTDFLYLALHLFRVPTDHHRISFDPKLLTIVIVCYNGEDVIGDTIRGALRHVPKDQIIVVSDKSTDDTVLVARSMGVRVFENDRNVNKAFSISNIARHVRTKYMLIVDDDTLIGKTFMPTSLLDEGYSAVAFNVMPLPTRKIVNKLQLFEYRKSMFLGKNLRGNVGAIGNVSGAVGMYRTVDLKKQSRLHSGQFGGEDQQRTVLVHIYSEGKGVTYTEGTVETHAPNTWKAWLRQRAFRWNLSLPELFTLYWRVLLDYRQHYLLKVEKAYQLFLYATDPLRILLIWTPILYPERLAILYLFYFFLSLATWIKLDREDPFWIVLVYPVYTHLEMICRFIAHFYWFKIKYRYIFREKFHKIVTDRSMVLDYLVVSVCIALIWTASIRQLIVTVGNVRTSNYTAVESTTNNPLPPIVIDETSVKNVIAPYSMPNQTEAN